MGCICENSNMCSITACSSGEELLEKHYKEKFDIIFLDIEMSGISGMDTARKIRSNDTKVIIVFLTNYTEFALEGYEVDAYRYLVKSQPYYILENQFRSVFDEYSQNHRCFVIKTRNDIICIRLNDICFFEVLNKKITVHTTVRSYEYVGKLSEIEEQLQNDDSFIRTHKSYIVNVAQIDIIRNYDIIMKNSEQALMSRSLKKSVVDKYISYMTGR
ncbi:MAG: LytR/AlgR family response regulator transcription factor [Oscillospiraceae bacterium]